jgi:hypothetical protein
MMRQEGVREPIAPVHNDYTIKSGPSTARALGTRPRSDLSIASWKDHVWPRSAVPCRARRSRCSNDGNTQQTAVARQIATLFAQRVNFETKDDSTAGRG